MMLWLLQSKILEFKKKKKKIFGRFDRENNIDESKIVFIHGRIEDVNLPVEKVKKIFNNFENLNLLNFLRLILSFPNGWVRQFMKGIIIRMRFVFFRIFSII